MSHPPKHRRLLAITAASAVALLSIGLTGTASLAAPDKASGKPPGLRQVDAK